MRAGNQKAWVSLTGGFRRVVLRRRISAWKPDAAPGDGDKNRNREQERFPTAGRAMSQVIASDARISRFSTTIPRGPAVAPIFRKKVCQMMRAEQEDQHTEAAVKQNAWQSARKSNRWYARSVLGLVDRRAITPPEIVRGNQRHDTVAGDFPCAPRGRVESA